MKKILTKSGLLLSFFLLSASVRAFEPQTKLSGRKDMVLSTESRQIVLEVGSGFIARPDTDYLAEIANLKNPFGFEDVAPVEVARVTEPEKEAEPVVVYDEAKVLEVAAGNFSRKVRGSISRGENRFLQLDGGALLKSGTGFPVRLPQAEGQTFTMTIAEITSRGYTLRIGDAEKTLTYENSPRPGSGTIRFSNP